MKKILFVNVVALMLTATYAFAQTDSGVKGEYKGETNQQDMKMDDEMMKQHMDKCQPMMKYMMDSGMMKKMMSDKKDLMQMMMDMMTMQEMMLTGPKAAEKKQMLKDMAQMKEKLQKMMSMPMPMEMMGKDDAKTGAPSAAEPHKH